MSDFIRSRELLGSSLRQIRRDAGLSTRQLATACGWLPSKVAQIEDGRQTPTKLDIDLWAAAANVTNIGPLYEQLSSLESFYRDWKRQSSSGIRGTQQRWSEIESRVQRLRVFEPHFVPGLLQTADYARGRLTAHATLHSNADNVADIEEAVATRMRRQAVLDETGKNFTLITCEAALLANSYEPPAVMLTQVERIIRELPRPNVMIGVIPMTQGWGVNVDHGFWMFDSEFVLVETVTAELRLVQPDEVLTYRRVFQQLSTAAVYGADVEALLEAVTQEIAARTKRDA